MLTNQQKEILTQEIQILENRLQERLQLSELPFTISAVKKNKHVRLITVQEVVEFVSNHFDVNPQAITSRANIKPLNHYRKMTAYLCEQLMDQGRLNSVNKAEISRKLGCSRNSGFYQLCDSCRNQMKKNASFHNKYKILKDAFFNSIEQIELS